jgi:hypothetical protein
MREMRNYNSHKRSLVSKGDRISKRLRARRVLGNLRSLQPKSAPQAFLTEEEDIDALLQRRG